MAFMERGDVPSINNGDGNGGNNGHFGSPMYYRFFNRWYYYGPLDSTCIIMSVIITVIVLIVVATAYLATYESTIIDPIGNVKGTFINIYSIILIICLVATLLTIFLSKEKNRLIKRLIVISVFSILVMIFSFGIKLSMDGKYTENAFEQFYTEQNEGADTEIASKIDIGIGGVTLKTEKEYYIDECVKLYNIFKVKIYAMLGVNLLLNILLIFIILKEVGHKEKRERLDKDDLILFDEEQNIKF